MTTTSLLGRAFRGKDNIIRWITWQSQHKNYTLAWLNEETGIWHFGGHCKTKDWAGSLYDGEEVAAPQQGETYKYAGVFGSIREVTV